MSKKDDNDFEERLRKLEEEVRILHRELKAQGVDVPEMSENPSKTPLSRESLLAVKRDLAARARAAKPVGKGKGAVSSASVKKKLMSNADSKRGKRQGQ